MTFLELGLDEQLLQAVSDLGFDTPTEIQEKAIPVLLEKKTDFIGLAQTGTGKTCAYGLPLLSKIRVEEKHPQGIILCPTRELCMQIALDLRQFSSHTRGLNVVPIYGGANIQTQAQQLKRGAHIIVATPGRLIDMMSRGVVETENISILILDEADEMLDMGFQEDLEQIFKALPENKQTWMFSATMEREVKQIADNYLSNPIEITIGKRNQTAENITHECYIVKPEHRYPSLRRLLDMIPDMYALIFRRTRVETQELADMLSRDGYAVEALHGDLSQTQRDHVMGRFRRKQLKILIATDVAARGIDVDDITHIIHYDLPDDLEIYTHRSGRTARAGKSGYSIVFVSPAERYRLGQLERRLKIHFESKLVPDGIDVCRMRLCKLAETIKLEKIDEDKIARFYPDVLNAFETITREDLIRGLVMRELQNIKGDHVSHQNLNANGTNKKKFQKQPTIREEKSEPPPPPPPPPHRKAEQEEYDNSNMRIIEINIGHVDYVKPGAIVRLICDSAGIESSDIGQISIGYETSFFQVDASVVDKVREKLRGAIFDGEPVDIRDADKMPERPPRPERPAYRNQGHRYGGNDKYRRGGGSYGRR